MPPVTTRIFPSAENPLGLALALSEQLRCSEPCPRSLSDGFRAAYPLASSSEGAYLIQTPPGYRRGRGGEIEKERCYRVFEIK